MSEVMAQLDLNAQSRINILYEQIPYGEHAKKCWLDHLKKHGIQDSQINILKLDTQELEINCYRLIRVYPEWFKDSIILTASDEIAKNLINAMTLEGFECGKDYSLVGIGNNADHGMESAKKLQISSIDLPIRLMAEESAKLLLYKISNPSECYCNVMIPTHFIKRKS
jgi:DNA-binding LacI/PurR family transcriptional regulator